MSSALNRVEKMVSYNTFVERSLRITIGITILALLLAGGGSAVPVEEWNRTFGGPGSDTANAVQQTSDSGYILAGSYEGGGAWLIKTDASGNQQWNKTFGGNWANSVQQTSDGGYVLAGAANWANGGDALLIKTDANGTQQWSKTFWETGTAYFNAVQQTSDGGYIIAGKSSSGIGGAWLIKTDASGIQEWSKIFENYHGDFSDVKQTPNGGYIIAGTIQIYGTNYDALLLKTDANGNQVWSKTFGGGLADYARSIQQTTDGGYIFAGTKSHTDVDRDAWLVKTDINGNKLWEKTFTLQDDNALSAQQTFDGEYIIAGYTNYWGSYDAWLFKTDANGNRLWSKTFGGTGTDIAKSVQQTSDGRYMISGHTNSYGVGGTDAWLIKVSDITTFDTGSGGYPSIMGTHNGTLKLNHSINVSKMYTYPSPGTGGHSEYAAFYRTGTLLASGNWTGYMSDWHNITFAPFVLEANVTYNYTIRTGSYPQIIHSSNLSNGAGTITSTEFIDANGRRYTDWIPAIRLE